MDHGPFTAVELLQQLVNHTFALEDDLRDEVSGRANKIAEWPEFSPFAEHAALKRRIVAETKEVFRLEEREKKAGLAKSTIGTFIVLAIAAAGAAFYFKVQGSRRDDVDVANDPSALDLILHGGVKGEKRAVVGGGGGGGGRGFPGGMSYEAAMASNVQEITMGGKSPGPDLTDSQLGGPMRNASFISGCGAPESMKATVKVAIKMGRAVGVSVYTNPPNPGVASCIDHAVRGLSWPANPKMDSFTTSY